MDATTLFDAFLPTLRQGSQQLYQALVPWVFIAAFALIVYEGYKVLQGKVFALPSVIIRVAIAVVLVSNFTQWTDTINRAAHDLVSSIGAAAGASDTQAVMTDYQNVLKNPGVGTVDPSNSNGLLGFWQSLTNPSGAIGETVLKGIMWLLGTIAWAIALIMNLVQRFFYLLGVAAAPIFIGLWMLSDTHSIGLKYIMHMVGLSLWPLGWAFGNLVTKAIIQVGVDFGNDWLTASIWILVIGGIWIVFNAIFWPIVITNTIISGSGAGSGWITSSVSTVTSTAASVGGMAAAAATGGVGTPVAAAGASLASRPSKSPSSSV